MTREERDLDGITVPGSDHLTAYNLYAEAFSYAVSMGELYGLPRHVFDDSARILGHMRLEGGKLRAQHGALPYAAALDLRSLRITSKPSNLGWPR